jgi:hypothetical protein
MLRDDIKTFACEIKIPFLIHFTRVGNLSSIMKNGIYPIGRADEIDEKPEINDLYRWDGKRNSTSVSIAFPNAPMFYKYRMGNPDVDWVVLVLDPSIILDKSCAFCRHNAADGRISNLQLSELKTIDAFKGVYDPIEGLESREEQKLKACDPTDVQAEILVFDVIVPKYIAGAVFDKALFGTILYPILGRRRRMSTQPKKACLQHAGMPGNISRSKLMAERPVFIPSLEGAALVQTKHVPFRWFPGMSASQKQKSIDSLHAAAHRHLGLSDILEVSSKSREELGVALSAFNLTFTTVKYQRTFSVECAFQGSKVFEHGGPYIDLLEMTSREAKKDERLRSSGRLVGFRFFGRDWELQPQTAFYDWLYISALKKQSSVIEQLLDYSAFTDIEFNPERSINCQAYSVALYVSLRNRGLLEEATSSKEAFLQTVGSAAISNARQDETLQGGFQL